MVAYTEPQQSKKKGIKLRGEGNQIKFLMSDLKDGKL